MSKFKVGDLITDKKTLVQIIDVKETHYTIKYIGGYYHGKITNTQKGLERFNSDDEVERLVVKDNKLYIYLDILKKRAIENNSNRYR